jgi:CDP-diacylglycerol---glycerol-3-phosphate 3-phosphatidyltransferase
MMQLSLRSMTIPTWVTLSRLLAVPVILLVFVWLDLDTARNVAAIAFLIAALTDWLDGYLARKLNQVTDFGKFLDPLADKLLVIAPLLVLVQLQQIEAWGVFLIVARELLITAWRGSPDQPKVVGANFVGKVKTVVQIIAIAFLLLQLPGALLLFWAAVALTLVSGIIYVLPVRDV